MLGWEEAPTVYNSIVGVEDSNWAHWREEALAEEDCWRAKATL